MHHATCFNHFDIIYVQLLIRSVSLWHDLPPVSLATFIFFRAGQAGGRRCLEMSHGDTRCPSGPRCNGPGWMNGQPLHCFLYGAQRCCCPTLIRELLGNWIPRCGDAQRRGRERDAQKECEICGGPTEPTAQLHHCSLPGASSVFVCLSSLSTLPPQPWKGFSVHKRMKSNESKLQLRW